MITTSHKLECDHCEKEIPIPKNLQPSPSWGRGYAVPELQKLPAIIMNPNMRIDFHLCQECMDQIVIFLDPKRKRRDALLEEGGRSKASAIGFNIWEATR